jgi:hypothetical protein
MKCASLLAACGLLFAPTSAHAALEQCLGYVGNGTIYCYGGVHDCVVWYLGEVAVPHKTEQGKLQISVIKAPRLREAWVYEHGQPCWFANPGNADQTYQCTSGATTVCPLPSGGGSK